MPARPNGSCYCGNPEHQCVYTDKYAVLVYQYELMRWVLEEIARKHSRLIPIVMPPKVEDLMRHTPKEKP